MIKDVCEQNISLDSITFESSLRTIIWEIYDFAIPEDSWLYINSALFGITYFVQILHFN